MRLLTLAALLLAGAITTNSASWAQNTPGPTLAAVLKKGYLECAVSGTTPGFSIVDSKGDLWTRGGLMYAPPIR